MSIANLLNAKSISLFVGIAALLLTIMLFIGDRRKLTAKRIIALCIVSVLGFAYFFNQP